MIVLMLIGISGGAIGQQATPTPDSTGTVPWTPTPTPTPTPPSGDDDTFEELWAFEADSRVAFVGAVEGLLYVVASEALYALDREDGSVVWREDVDRWDPVVVDGVVYMTVDGRLVARDARDGSLLWRADVEVSEPPVVDQGTVYVISQGAVFALDTVDGSERWEGRGTPADHDRLLVEDGAVYLFDSARSGPGGMAVLDAEDGTLRWHESDGYTQPVALDGVAYFYSGGETVARDAEDGSRIWSLESHSNPTRQTVIDGRLFISGTFDIWAVDPSDGTVLWKVPAGRSDVQVHDDLVYLHRGKLTVSDVSDGSSVWSTPARYSVSSPLIVDGIVYHGTEMFDDGTTRLFARNSSDGRELWRMAFDSPFARPLIDDGSLFVAHGKTVSAFDTGEALPPFPAPAGPVVNGSPGVDAFLALVAMAGGLFVVTRSRQGVR